MNIFVGNLPREINDEDLKQAFSAFGQVTSVSIIKDKFTGEPRGFAFVEMASKEEGQAAITALSGKDMKGRSMTVNEARPKNEGGGHGHGGGGRGGFGGGRGGFGGGRGKGGHGGGGKSKGGWGRQW